MRQSDLSSPASRLRPRGSARVSRRELARRTLAVGAGMALPRGGLGLRGPVGTGADPDRSRSDDNGSTLTVATNRAPSDLDPHSAYDAGSALMLQGPYEGLVRLRPGASATFDGVLAESWKVSPDGRTWTFTIRDGVRFHDGTPLDAEAVRASHERILRLGLAPSNVLARFVADPSQIVATDRRTLVFDLGRPRPTFGAALASAYGTAVVNVAALRAHEADGDWGHAWAQANTDGIGTGPYRVTGFDPDSGAVLERHDAYWGGWDGAHFARVALRVVVEPESRRALVERGEADIAITLPIAAVQAMAANPDLVVDRSYDLSVRYLAMTAAGPLATAAARQALCWAFPYEQVVAGVYDGHAKPAVGPVAELCQGFDPRAFVYHTDLDRARSLLRQAGVAVGTPLTLMLVSGNAELAATVELLRANLAEAGLRLDVQSVDYASYVGVVTGDGDPRPDLFPMLWVPDYDDAYSQLWPQLACAARHSGNAGHYCNQRVEGLLGQADRAADAAGYLAALAEVQTIVTRDDPAAVYYLQPERQTVLRRDLAGYVPNLVVGDIVDFRALHRAVGTAGG